MCISLIPGPLKYFLYFLWEIINKLDYNFLFFLHRHLNFLVVRSISIPLIVFWFGSHTLKGLPHTEIQNIPLYFLLILSHALSHLPLNSHMCCVNRMKRQTLYDLMKSPFIPWLFEMLHFPISWGLCLHLLFCFFACQAVYSSVNSLLLELLQDYNTL